MREHGLMRPALVVEQDRVFDRRREHAAFLQTDDEDAAPAVESGVGERRDVQRAGTRPVAADRHRLDARADESERRREVASMRTERVGQVGQRGLERDKRHGIEGARARRVA